MDGEGISGFIMCISRVLRIVRKKHIQNSDT